MPVKPWERLSSEIRADYRIFRLRVDRSRSPRTGKTHDFYVLESSDWVNVIPLTPEGQVVLVRQWRHGTRSFTLEVPGGLLESSDSPEEAARRELLEETGCMAGQMLYLGFVEPNPAFLNNKCHTFLAKHVERVSELKQDEKEDIEVLLKPLGQIPRLISEGIISHSLVVAAFYRLFLEKERWLPPDSQDLAGAEDLD